MNSLTANTWFWSKRIVEFRSWVEEMLSSYSAQTNAQFKLLAVWNAYFQANAVQDYKRCQEYADEFISLARILDNEQAKIRWHYLAGYVYIGNGDYESAADAFAEGLAPYKDSGDLFWIGVFEDALGTSLLLLNNYEAAETAMMEALEALSKIQFQVIIIEVLSSLGYLMLERKQLQRAGNICPMPAIRQFRLALRPGYRTY